MEMFINDGCGMSLSNVVFWNKMVKEVGEKKKRKRKITEKRAATKI